MQTLPNSPEQLKAALAAIQIVAGAIKEAGTIPAGHLYAMLMEHGCTLEQFNRITGVLVAGGIVSRSGDVLTWKAN